MFVRRWVDLKNVAARGRRGAGGVQTSNGRRAALLAGPAPSVGPGAGSSGDASDGGRRRWLNSGDADTPDSICGRLMLGASLTVFMFCAAALAPAPPRTAAATPAPPVAPPTAAAATAAPTPPSHPPWFFCWSISGNGPPGGGAGGLADGGGGGSTLWLFSSRPGVEGWESLVGAKNDQIADHFLSLSVLLSLSVPSCLSALFSSS